VPIPWKQCKCLFCIALYIEQLTVLLDTHTFIHKWNERHRTLAGTHFPPPEDRKLSWPEKAELAWSAELRNCLTRVSSIRTKTRDKWTADDLTRHPSSSLWAEWTGNRAVSCVAVIGSRPSDHYFRSVCLSVCLFVCAKFFSAVFGPISIKLGHMLHVWI